MARTLSVIQRSIRTILELEKEQNPRQKLEERNFQEILPKAGEQTFGVKTFTKHYDPEHEQHSHVIDENGIVVSSHIKFSEKESPLVEWIARFYEHKTPSTPGSFWGKVRQIFGRQKREKETIVFFRGSDYREPGIHLSIEELREHLPEGYSLQKVENTGKSEDLRTFSVKDKEGRRAEIDVLTDGRLNSFSSKDNGFIVKLAKLVFGK